MTAGPPSTGLEILQLSRGIWATRQTDSVSGPRRGVMAIRSTPWNAGGEFNPWHDEFDLDHGHVRYFGDHRVDTIGFPGATLGNRMLMESWALHSATNRDERIQAPPILIFRSRSAVRRGRRELKGQVEFCGVGLIERLEHVVQRDPKSGRASPTSLLISRWSIWPMRAMLWTWHGLTLGAILRSLLKRPSFSRHERGSAGSRKAGQRSLASGADPSRHESRLSKPNCRNEAHRKK